MKVLDVHNFSVKFKQNKTDYVEVVKSINFEINQGEILGLIGESGSGKSVTSQAITNLIDGAITSGEVLFHFKESSSNLLSCTSNELRSIRENHISYIFQEPMTALNPLISCDKQILESSNDKTKEYLYALLEKVELYDHQRVAESFPHELSGGQRQRIMIAMALAKNPTLLIADEPTTALDIAVQTEILSLLKKLCKSTNLSILFITHDLLSLDGFADKIAVMYHGEIVEFDDSSNILKAPKHPYSKALIESRATYTKRGKVLAEIDDLLEEKEGQLTYVDKPSSLLSKQEESLDVVLQLKNIEKSHFKSSFFKKEETKVLHNINLELNQGDILGLIGESGSGKSTIAKLILKIWSQTSGDINLLSKNLDELNDISDTLQLVFQDPFSSLNPKHRVGNAIVEVLETLQEKSSKSSLKEKAISLLEEVGLTASDFEKYPHEFSGGQRQRICIAKSLAKNPKIIVLDEAVSALDVSVQAKVLNLLNDLKRKKGLTYLLISHDMNVIGYFCNKIVVLRDGKIVEAGKTEKLIAAPESDYTKSLMDHSTK